MSLRFQKILHRIKWLAILALSFLTLFSYTFRATATNHRGLNGPGPFSPPPSGNYGGRVWGTVIVGDQPIAGAVVSMIYNGKTITTTTLWIPDFESYPFYMFDIRPLTELSVTYGTSVTISASYAGQEFPAQERLLNHPQNDTEVSFGGVAPLPAPPQPEDPEPSMVFSSVVASHLLDVGGSDSGGPDTCTVVSGAIWCWGTNDSGKLGDGTTTAHNTPVRARNLVNVKAVSTSSSHTCALLLIGTVECWGSNLYGQLGATQSNVFGADDLVDIAVGHGSTCGLLSNHQVKCLGLNAQYQLGLGITNTFNLTPTYVLRDKENNLPLDNVTAIAAWDLNYCAIADGGMWCWGQYRGSPITGTASTPTGTLPSQIIPAKSGVVAIATGYSESCAVKSNGELWCWSSGSKMFPASSLTQIELPNQEKAAKVAVGHTFYCVLSRTSKVYCAGDNDFGQLGRSEPHYTKTLLLVTGLAADIVDLAAEWRHACVRTAQGKVQCWGSNTRGELGDGSGPITARYQPVTVNVPAQVGSKIEAGGLHACRITPAGALQCWGANQFGQLGNGTSSLYELTPTTVSGMNSGVLTVTAGSEHTCAIQKDNNQKKEVWCWGRGDNKQIGKADTQSSTIPSIVPGLDTEPLDLAAGASHTCALLLGGTVKCWGYGLGSQPITISGFSGIVQQISAGYNHTCARLDTGYVQCWGSNQNHRLGNDSLVDSLTTAVTVTNLISVTDLAVAEVSTCAVHNGENSLKGGVKCWGSFQLQIADGTVITQPTLPVSIFGLTSGVRKVQMGNLRIWGGFDFACVLLDTGAVQCFGRNINGNLGVPSADIPSTNNSVTPINVTQMTSNVVDLSINPAGEFVCAQLTDGSTRCWGENSFGQLGMGVADTSYTPVTVPGLEPTQWTYMLYLVGDNDLSSYLETIKTRLEKELTSTANINIVVMLDGEANDDTNIWVIQGKNGQGYRSGRTRIRVDETQHRMSDPETLQWFINYAHSNYPAQHYYLSIADHGRATSGTGWDAQSGKLDTKTDKLTPVGLRSALANATSNGAWKLDILHFDSCLMGLLEMAYQIKEYANYMIASENLTFSVYPYKEYADLVQNNPTITPRELASKIVDAYFNVPYLQINNQPRTIAAYDLSKIDSVMSALDSLAEALLSKLGTERNDIEQARTRTQKFDSSPDETQLFLPETGLTETVRSYYTITNTDTYLDLRDLATQLSVTVGISALNLATILDDSNGFVITNHHQSGRDLVSRNIWDLDHSYGVAIYFPSLKGDFDYANYVNGSLFTFTANSQWDEFLASYLIGTSPITSPDPGIPPVLKPTRPITNHCSQTDNCLYGAVYSNSLPVAGAVVTVQYANHVLRDTTVLTAGNETFPVYQITLDALNAQPGDLLTVTATYAGEVSEPVTLIMPERGEHLVNLVFKMVSNPSPLPPPQVTVLNAWAWPAIVTDSTQHVMLRANAVASDESDIIAYHWKSDLDGELGSGENFVLPATTLRVGEHKLTVRAINQEGIESNPYTVTVQVESHPSYSIFLPLISR